MKLGKEEIKATPLKSLESTSDMVRQSHAAQIIKQNNFTNIHLQIIGKQIERIENFLSELKGNTGNISQAKTTLNKPPAIIIPHYMKEGIELGNKGLIKMNQIDEFVQELYS